MCVSVCTFLYKRRKEGFVVRRESERERERKRERERERVRREGNLF